MLSSMYLHNNINSHQQFQVHCVVVGKMNHMIATLFRNNLSVLCWGDCWYFWRLKEDDKSKAHSHVEALWQLLLNTNYLRIKTHYNGWGYAECFKDFCMRMYVLEIFSFFLQL